MNALPPRKKLPIGIEFSRQQRSVTGFEVESPG